MTIFYPDVSGWTPVTIRPDTVFAVCKATQASTLVDPYYSGFVTQCINLRIPHAAYHWLNHGNITAQVDHALMFVENTPLMLDAEDMSGNTGFNGSLTVNDIVDFVTLYRRAGGICHVVYLPKWYWENNMSRPDLSIFNSMGLSVVSSNYSAPYSDNGPGWASYGGIAPKIWQYTSAFPYSGELVDMNAFKGSVDELIALFSGGNIMTPDQEKELLRNAHNADWTLTQLAAGFETIGGLISIDGTQAPPIHNILTDILKTVKTLTVPASVLTDQDRTLITGLTNAITSLEAVLKAAGNATP